MSQNLLLLDIDNLTQELGDLGHTCWSVEEIVGEMLSCSQDAIKIVDDWQKQLFKTKRFLPHWKMKLGDNVWIHTQRLENMIQSVEPLLVKWNQSNPEKRIDINYLKAFLKVHDLPEWLIKSVGDIPSHIKSSLSPESKAVLWEIEILTLKAIWAKPLWIPEKDFEKFLEDIDSKRSIEAKLASYLDKLDGFCAALYEFLHGNDNFLTPLINYIKIFRKFQNSEIEQLVKDIFGLSWDFNQISFDNWASIREIKTIQFSPHLFSPASIYKLWYKNGTRDNADKNGLEQNLLALRKSFLEKCDASWSDINTFQTEEVSDLPPAYLAWIWVQNIALYNPEYHTTLENHL